MAHTYTNILIHALFSTKDRDPWLNSEVRTEVFDYLGGTINKLGGQSLLVNRVSDHVHLLFVLPAALSLAALMEKVKASSSCWVKRRWAGRRAFAWRKGYAAFSVSKSQANRVKQYIARQAEHHHQVSFHEEVLVPQKTGNHFRPEISVQLSAGYRPAGASHGRPPASRPTAQRQSPWATG